MLGLRTKGVKGIRNYGMKFPKDGNGKNFAPPPNRHFCHRSDPFKVKMNNKQGEKGNKRDHFKKTGEEKFQKLRFQSAQLPPREGKRKWRQDQTLLH